MVFAWAAAVVIAAVAILVVVLRRSPEARDEGVAGNAGQVSRPDGDESFLNDALEGPIGDDFAAQSVFVRPPKGWSRMRDAGIQVDGLYDLLASFGSQSHEVGQPSRLHVLARRKAESGGRPANRGDFMADTRTVLAANFGGEALEAPLEAVTKQRWPRSASSENIEYQRMKLTNMFTAAPVHVYFFNEASGQAVYSVALVWEFAPAGGGAAAGLAPAARSASRKGDASRGMDLTLGTLAVGGRAARSFTTSEARGLAPPEFLK